MAWPTTELGITVRMAFGANPADDPSEWDSLWVDVTDDTRVEDKISKTYGRSDELGTADPSRCTFTLNDFDRAYTPYDHTGAHYPDVVRGCPVEILVDAGDGDVEWFRGFVTSYAPGWDRSGNVPTTTVTASGVLGRLAQGARRLNSPLYRAYAATNPLAWWTLSTGDGSESTEFPSALNDGSPLAAELASAGSHRASGVVGGTATGPAGEPVAVDLSGGGQLSGIIPGVDDTAAWRFEIDILMDPVDVLDSGQIFQLRYGAGSAIGLFAGDFGFAVEGFDAVDTDSASPPAIVLDDGVWHHIRLDCSSLTGGTGTQVDITIDGSTGTSTSFENVAFGALRKVIISPTGDVKAACHPIAWEGSDLPSSVNFGSTAAIAHAGESAATRMLRLCTEESVDFELVGQTGSSAMGAQGIDTLLGLLRDCESTDHGFLYEQGFGLAYRTRLGRYNRSVDLELLASDLREAPAPVDDDQHLATTVTVQRRGGGSQRYENEAATAKFGLYDRGTLTLNNASDSVLYRHAAWMTHLGSTSQMRVDKLEINLRARPDLIPSWVANAPGAHVTISSLPGSRMPEGIDVIVEGASEVIDWYTWDVSAGCSPYTPWEVWQVDTGGSSLVVGVNAAATSLKLATSVGPDWSTSTEPYHIQINGEAMTVTAMSTDTPAYIAAGAIANGNNASVSPALPAGITPDVGQALFILASIRNSGTGTVNTPAGWSQLAVSGNVALLGKYYVTGDAAPTITFTGGVANADTQARMWAMSGVSLELAGATGNTKGTPAYAAQLNSSAQNIAYPLLAIKRSGGVIFYLGWKQDDWTSVATVGDAEIADNPTTTGDDSGIVADYDIYTTAVDVAAGSFTVTGGASAISRGIVAAFRPLQSATVTRGVNGSAVTHAAGSAVNGWRLGVNSL